MEAQEKQPHEMTFLEWEPSQIPWTQGGPLFPVRSDKSLAIGQEFEGVFYEGKEPRVVIWRMVGQNDLCFPYYIPLNKNGNLPKNPRRYTVDNGYQIAHFLIIKRALSEGKDVPENVMEEYLKVKERLEKQVEDFKKFKTRLDSI